MRAKITERLLDSLPTPAVGELKVWDTELRGFVVRVRASGRRWFAVEWMRERRTRRLSLGEHGAVTVDQARDRARKILGRVAHGEDPAAERADARSAHGLVHLYGADGAEFMAIFTHGRLEVLDPITDEAATGYRCLGEGMLWTRDTW